MKKQNFLVTLILITSFSTSLFSQNEPFSGGLFENYGVALKVGSYGIGVDLSTSLHPNIKARLGFNYFDLAKKSGLEYDVVSLYGNDITVTADKVGLHFSNLNLLVDFFPVQSGVFHLTAGFYFGQNKIQASGTAPEAFGIEDYVIVPDADGTFAATLKLGGAVKPYLGIGLGRTIPKSRVGFKFELGMVYQGNLKIESDNMDVSELQSGLQSSFDQLDIPKVFTQFWPMLTFSLSYRIQ